jgi:hypothetical protein
MAAVTLGSMTLDQLLSKSKLRRMVEDIVTEMMEEKIAELMAKAPASREAVVAPVAKEARGKNAKTLFKNEHIDMVKARIQNENEGIDAAELKKQVTECLETMWNELSSDKKAEYKGTRRTTKEDKPKRVMAAGTNQYTNFVKAKIAEVKAENPGIEHMAAFKQAAAMWKTAPENPKVSGIKATAVTADDDEETPEVSEVVAVAKPKAAVAKPKAAEAKPKAAEAKPKAAEPKSKAVEPKSKAVEPKSKAVEPKPKAAEPQADEASEEAEAVLMTLKEWDADAEADVDIECFVDSENMAYDAEGEHIGKCVTSAKGTKRLVRE